MAPSTNWLGRSPFKAVMLGSNPAGATIRLHSLVLVFLMNISNIQQKTKKTLNLATIPHIRFW